MRGSVITFSLLLALFLLLIVRNVSPEPYVYDEADYMYAASLGFAANWMDSPSIRMLDFIHAGLGGAGRLALSERIRRGNDALFYRHFHGPLFDYLLIGLSRYHLPEQTMRALALAIPALSLAVIYFGTRSWLAALLFLCSYSVLGATELAPHQLFALCSLTSLILLMKAVATGRHRFWYGAVVAAGLALCTLEVAVVLLITLAVCCILERRHWNADGWFAARSIILFLATVLAIWPAAILKLSFLKACVAMAYLSLRPYPWGNVGFAEAWGSRILNSPIEWLLILMGIALYARNRGAAYPLGLFAAIMLGVILRVVTVTPRYSLALMPVLDVLAGLALAPLLGTLRRPASFAVVALAIAGLYGSAWYQVAHRPRNPNPRSAAVVTYIHQNELENKAVLAPQNDIPTLHYYFPGMRLRGYLGDQPAASDWNGFQPDAAIAAARP